MSLIAVKGFFAARTLNMLLFTIACAMAWFFKWQADDLAWSLWLSNLFVTGAIIVCTTVIVAQKEPAFALIGAVLFLFSITFHLGQTVPLFAALPFEGRPLNISQVKDTYAAIFTRYWMWLPLAFYHCRDPILHPPNVLKNDPKTTGVLKSIVFFNVLIYVLIGFNKLLKLDGFGAAFFMYFMYFFFFDRDLRKSRAKNP